MKLNKNKKLFQFAGAVVILAVSSSPAAIISLAGGSEGGAVLQGEDRFVIDLGFVVPSSLPVSTDLALFEAGGDGDGTAISVLGSSLNIYLDSGVSNIFADDTTIDLNLSAFAGQVVSIRLQGNYTGASAGTDIVQLDVFDGTSTISSSSISLTTNYTQPAGGDGFGTGGRGGGSWPGISEANGIGGTPNMSQFSTGYDLSDGGANILGSDVIVGTLYIGATDSDAALSSGIPDPSSWGLVPEPSGIALLALGSLSALGRRRR